MDKKTTRKILFKKADPSAYVGATVAAKKKPKKSKVETTRRTEISLLDRSKKLYAWINDHPLINLNGVCLKVKIDRANFVKGMKKEKELRLDMLTKLTGELKQYGYVE